MSDEIKDAIVAYLEKSTAKGKKKLYAKDITKGLESFDKREVKKCLQEMLNDSDRVAYWSSGSTTYVMLKEEWEKLKALEEEG